MRPEKYQYDEEAKRFKKEHRIPQYVIRRVNKLPFDDGTCGEVEKIPQTYQSIRPFPDPRYFVKKLQEVQNFSLKLIN
jgi:hypothetical protein